jgi:RNA polymerase sigma factor (sigma-70 family)
MSHSKVTKNNTSKGGGSLSGEPDIRELCRLIKEGEGEDQKEGFRRFWRSRVGRVMIRKCMRMEDSLEGTLRSVDWEELVQECNIRIYLSLKNKRIEDIENPEAYLAKIIGSVCLSAMDRASIGKGANKQFLVQEPYFEDTEELDGELYFKSKELEFLQMELGSLLGEKCQSRLELGNLMKQAGLSRKDQKTLIHYCEGRDIKELAEEENVSEKAISVRINRITAKMKKVAEKYKNRT